MLKTIVKVLLLHVLDGEPGTVVVIVVIVRDDGLGGYRLNDLIISNPLDFAWLRIAVIQADHFHVLADRRVDSLVSSVVPSSALSLISGFSCEGTSSSSS
uniref:Secreted protein n=1 Tax=Anopheles coluzzii TaxID=1518534 RepID=A0A8W7PHP3_ANOCL